MSIRIEGEASLVYANSDSDCVANRSGDVFTIDDAVTDLHCRDNVKVSWLQAFAIVSASHARANKTTTWLGTEPNQYH